MVYIKMFKTKPIVGDSEIILNVIDITLHQSLYSQNLFILIDGVHEDV